MDRISREQVIQLAREIADRLGFDRLTRSTFSRESGIALHQIYNLFPEGGWTAVIKAAGLKSEGSGYPLDDEELLAEFHRVVSELGRVPTWRVFDAHSNISVDTVRRRFGGLQGTLKKYQHWLEENLPDSPILKQLDIKSKHEVPAPPSFPKTNSSETSPQWPKMNRTEYGAPITFRGLRHAPINEQGVVYLFGMVSYELGFIVEAIQATYPDCEAKRCIDSRRNRWQRVRIEFEYKSSNFLEHGHDPSGCDIIVCWEHDWNECPLEVLELRSVINELDG